MDPMLLLILAVLTLTIWTFVPAPARAAVRGGMGPLIHALAEGVRAIARPILRGIYVALCAIFGVEPTPARAAPRAELSRLSARDTGDADAEVWETAADAQTDRQTDHVSAHPLGCARLQLDRTRAAAIEALLYNGWRVTDLRREGLLRGDNAAVGAEVEAARVRLGLAPPPAPPITVREREREYQLDRAAPPAPRRPAPAGDEPA